MASNHTRSSLSEEEIYDTDIWSFLFERENLGYEVSKRLFQSAETGQSRSYCDIRDMAQQFGKILVSNFGWCKGDTVAVVCENAVDVPIAIWGYHWAGGIVSPMNPLYTAQELTRALISSSAKMIVTQSSRLRVVVEAADAVPIPRNRILVLDDDRDPDKDQELQFSSIMQQHFNTKTSRPAIIPQDDLAFLVFSSGTTGLPKGVMLTHSNIVADVSKVAAVERSKLSHTGTKLLSVLPFYHIYGLTTLVHLPVLLGLETVVMGNFDIRSFCSNVQEHKITYAYVAPPIILQLVQAPLVDNYVLSTLSEVTCGAAPLSSELIKALNERLRIGVRQAYGLSETSSVSHMQRYGVETNITGSVGPALPGLVVQCIPPGQAERCPGVRGEIWIKGPTIFKGYYKNPEASQQSLTDDGFFKTGDIGYEDQHRNLFIVDRLKDMIKYNGFPISPSELEDILLTHSNIKDAAVIGMHLQQSATELPTAVVIPISSVKPTLQEAKRIIVWFNDQVAPYKRLRGGLHWVTDIPKSSSGKVLKRELQATLTPQIQNNLGNFQSRRSQL